MHVRLSLVLAGFIPFIGFGGSIARAETINCTAVTTIPATISSPGVYCLTGDLDGTSVGNGQAITIDADNVTLDLKGHTLKGPTTLLNTGIFVKDGHRNVTIRNGTVLAFDQQIRETGRGNVIEDMRLDGGYEYPIVSNGQGALIRRNFVVNFRIGGIAVSGAHSHVIDNDIACDSCSGFFGIEVAGENHFVVDNRITATDVCGVRVINGAGQVIGGAGNKIRDNIVNLAATPYCGGVDVGNNN